MLQRILFSLIMLILYLSSVITEKQEVQSDPVNLIVNIAFDDCTNIKKVLGFTYELLSNQAKNKLKDIYLKLYTATGEIDFSLEDAHTKIPKSQFFHLEISTVIITHGHKGSSDSVNIDSLANEILSLKTVNVLVLDHKAMTNDNYYAATTYVRYIGEKMGSVLFDLERNGVSNFHLIGHSLGAHIWGIAGKFYKKISGKSIQRITGLDPAGPCYFHEGIEKRLTSSDADFVDVIHTNTKHLGFSQPLGHVDFYPNGGEKMPGCFLELYCSHTRAILYFIESVRNDNFVSRKCSNYKDFLNRKCSSGSKLRMGYNTPSNTQLGIYYLKTNIHPLFAIGDKEI